MPLFLNSQNRSLKHFQIKSISSGYPLKGLIMGLILFFYGDDRMNAWLIFNDLRDGVKIPTLTAGCEHYLMYLSKMGGKGNSWMHIYVGNQRLLLSVVCSGVRAHFYFTISVLNRYKCNAASETHHDNIYFLYLEEP